MSPSVPSVEPSAQSPDHKKFKKTRRGKPVRQKNLDVYYCNVNGFKSKVESIKNIVEKHQPQIMALCETKLGSGQVIKNALPGYEVCIRNCKTGQKGSAVCVKLNTFRSVLDVTSSNSGDIMVVRIEMTMDNVVRIILGYAPQENEPVEVREEFFTDLEIEIAKSKMADEVPILVGDLNAKIEKRDKELQATTSNGKHLVEMVKNQELEVLNFHEKCCGKWTHVIRTTGASSVLDYIISTKEMANAVQQIIIDEDCVMCPFSLKKKNKSDEIQFSDHNAIMLKLRIKYEKKNPPPSSKSWRITADGLKKLAQLTDDVFETKGEIELDTNNIQKLYDTYEQDMVQIMDQCFQVRKSPTTQKTLKHMLPPTYHKVTEFSKGGKVQRRVARQYIEAIINDNKEKVAERQKEKIHETLANLTVNNTFSPDKFWKLCKKVKKKGETGTSVETEDGNEIFGDEMIRNAYQKEFQHRLRKRTIDDDLQNYEARTEMLCKLYLDSMADKSPPYTTDELEKVRKNLKKGKSPGRDNLPAEVFIEGGTKMQKSTLKLLNRIKGVNEIPQQWTEVQISTMYKNKGKRKQLVNQRGIFLKQVLAKMYGKLNMNRAASAMDTINRCQAGGIRNRSTADQTFLLRAASDHCKYVDRPLFITLYDYSQCFDSLWLSDSLLSLIKIGVDMEIVTIIQKLNETCNIIVKTPTGMTEEFQMKNIVQQGSISGGPLCVASTAEIAEEDLGTGCMIGLAIIKALAFVDDIATLSCNHIDAYKAHQSVQWFSDKKRLLLNALKCLLLCINVKQKDVIPRLKIGNTVLKKVEKAAYLGDVFNEHGDNKDLIADRVKKGKAVTINAMSLCSELTMGMYTIQTLILLYRCMFLAVVLYNAQAWSNLNHQNIQDLQVLQLSFLKRMMHAPKSTSNTITFLETGTIPIHNEIHIKQLMFLYHILLLEDDDPVKVTHSQQLMYPYESNWGNATVKLREKYEISEGDEEIKNMSKESWKNLVKTKVYNVVLKELCEKAAQQKTARNLTYSTIGIQEYMNKLPSENARKIFHIRSGSIDLRGHRRYKYGNETSCRLCGYESETVTHVVNECPWITRNGETIDFLGNDCDELLVASQRCIDFSYHVEEMEDLNLLPISVVSGNVDDQN